MRYSVADCRLSDLRAILPELRPGDRAELAAVCIPARHVLAQLWRQSFLRRSATIDGTIGAVWGCSGTLAGSEGFPWLFTTAAVEKLPLAFFRQARAELAELLTIKGSLETGVLRSYDRSIRFWKMLGFAPVGEYELGGQPFLKLRAERS